MVKGLWPTRGCRSPLKTNQRVAGRSKLFHTWPTTTKLRETAHEAFSPREIATSIKAPDYESGGQEFESLRARHLICWQHTNYFRDWLLPAGCCRWIATL